MSWRPLRAYAEVTIGRQRSPKHESGGHITRYLRAANVNDGQLDLTDIKEMNFEPAEQRLFSLRPGDILITEGSGSLASVGATAVWRGELDGTVCFQNTVLRVRPLAMTDGRFLAWWCRHAFSSGLFASIATGANIYHLSAERVRSLPMTSVPGDRQRAIADFLDTETARIDALITKKRRLIDLLEEKLDAERSQVIWGQKGAQIPLMHLTPTDRQIMYGIVLPGPDVAEGVPIIKGGDVANDLNRPLCRTTVDIESGYARSRLRRGDLVFAIRGGIGDVAVVPEGMTGANITQDVARVALGAYVDGTWLLHTLRSRELQGQARMRVTGATIQGLNIWDLKRLSVPLVEAALQKQQAATLDQIEEAIVKASLALQRQLTLLQEHRQALITAAVTGELDIPGAA